MSDIKNEWKELLPKIGNLISNINSENYQINVKLKELQKKEERQAELQAQIDKAYSRGIQDLYNAICCLFAPCGRVPLMPIPDMRRIFGTIYPANIIVENTPEEIIDKVNQWKVEKEKQAKEQDFHVGDEVMTDSGHAGIIADVGDDDSKIWIVYRITPAARGLDFCWVNSANCKKTGRYFDSIPFDYNPEKEE